MSITLRALNAQTDGSVLELIATGQPPQRIVASERLIVQDTVEIAPHRTAVLLKAFAGSRGEIALLDKKEARFVHRAPLPSGTPERLLRRPGDNRLVVLGRAAVVLVDPSDMRILETWSGARARSDGDWDLVDVHSLSDADRHKIRRGKPGDGHFPLAPTIHATVMTGQGTLRWVDITFDRIEHGQGFFHTFTAALSSNEIDLARGVLRRQSLWSGYAQDYKNDQKDVIAISPDGRRALTRQVELVATPHSVEPGFLQRIFQRTPQDPTRPPPGHIALQATQWDLDSGTKLDPLDLVHVPISDLSSDFERLSRLAAPPRFDAPPAPRPMGKPATPLPGDPTVLGRIAGAFPLDVAWQADGSRVVLLVGGLLRQIAADGQTGPLLQPGPLPVFPVSPGASPHTLDTARLRVEAPDVLWLESEAAAARIVLPPFRPVPLADSTVTEIAADTHRTKDDWTGAFDIVRKMLLSYRPANIRIPNKTPESILAGLPKMSDALRTRFDDVMTENAWSPLFIVRGAPFVEDAFCRTLLEARAPGTVAALSELITVFVRHYPYLLDAQNADRDRTCLTDCVVTTILLSERIPSACWRWVCRRDAGHDEYFANAVVDRILPATGLDRPDILKLVVRIGVQEFATQNYTDSILTIGPMLKLRAALHDGTISPQALAQLLRLQTVAQARSGGLSWSSSVGIDGFLAEVARRLDRERPSESALARALAID